jgi:hypothetical protein
LIAYGQRPLEISAGGRIFGAGGRQKSRNKGGQEAGNFIAAALRERLRLIRVLLRNAEIPDRPMNKEQVEHNSTEQLRFAKLLAQ